VQQCRRFFLFHQAQLQAFVFIFGLSQFCTQGLVAATSAWFYYRSFTNCSIGLRIFNIFRAFSKGAYDRKSLRTRLFGPKALIFLASDLSMNIKLISRGVPHFVAGSLMRQNAQGMNGMVGG
jgi:hypothetical protein